MGKGFDPHYCDYNFFLLYFWQLQICNITSSYGLAVVITKEEMFDLDLLLYNSGTVGIWTCETMSLLLILYVVTSELILNMHLKDLTSVQPV
jgi:hypothetical protein